MEAASSPAVAAVPAPAAPESRAPESPYITDHITPPRSAERRAQPHIEAPTPASRQELIDAPVDGDFEEGDEDDDPDLDDDDDGGDDDDDGDDDGDDDQEDDGDDEDGDDIEDALFNAACGSVEQGDKYTWNELIGSLCAAEVEDPRLGLLVALLVEQDDQGQPVALTGARVLQVLEDLELGDIVEEAKEVAEAADAAGDAPEERAVVRTNARELREQAERELAGKPKPRDPKKPIKASQLRSRQTALGGSVPVPSGRPER